VESYIGSTEAPTNQVSPQLDNLEAVLDKMVSSRLTQLEEDFNSSLRTVEDTLKKGIVSLKKLSKSPTQSSQLAALASLKK
jgi:hypothetical protein